MVLPYPTMTVDEIAALPIGGMAEDDAHLYLWTIQSRLRQTFAIAEAWGFRPSYTLVWAKGRAGVVGGTFCSNVEFILFCRRGTLQAKRRHSTQWFQWTRGEHSQKPEAFLDLVEETSPGPYLELFARRNRLGWDTWGNESLEHVDLSRLSTSPNTKERSE
jgi:N6-adenosine-specific RNA methylase IME4